MTSTHRNNNSIRTTHAVRKVVVPDRMIKRTAGVAPIINKPHQATVASTVAQTKLVPTIKRRPIKSSHVHATVQPAKVQKRIKAVKPSISSVADQMQLLITPRRRMHIHLARTARRADVLAHAMQKEDLTNKTTSKKRFSWRGLINGRRKATIPATSELSFIQN